MNNQNKIHYWGNCLGLLGVCIVLMFAFYQQLITYQLPCPLCLLQRVCFIGVGLCLSMNLKFGIKISHYGLMILSALLGLAIALRQVFLHVSPGDLGYGSPLLGIYLYTWAAIGFGIVIGLIAIALLLEREFTKKSPIPSYWHYLLICFFLILILANGISTFLECGPFICKDNPIHYYLLDSTG
ncbi:disulfide bond formation protein B [Legionella micdadei]|uniref:Disulfide bond formation protein DsbB n=1 Tax=Legionella micdadei TaxID=451 RepID=A0A098GBS9_LEGMI|nr:disulfide bond formation protein B [Legionella micdadei]ARG98373.1 disulfide bond formation protein B [Legionella micdadei]KTD27306.1 transmembrane protein [Legionella micdadei]NSL18690.1 disulfide bond formation protein B [Legionella micdadei]CEG59953.1 Inner (Transmembrane) protein [Legionella micdadei]SCY60130.1 Disulfide bond formation protein DsbB [Legionella micdadei]